MCIEMYRRRNVRPVLLQQVRNIVAMLSMQRLHQYQKDYADES